MTLGDATLISRIRYSLRDVRGEGNAPSLVTSREWPSCGGTIGFPFGKQGGRQGGRQVRHLMSDSREPTLYVLGGLPGVPPWIMVAVMACVTGGCHRASSDTGPEIDFRAPRFRLRSVVHNVTDNGPSPADEARASDDAPRASAAGAGSHGTQDEGTVGATEPPAAPPAASEVQRSQAPAEPSEAAAGGAASARGRAAFPGRQPRDKPLSASAAADRAGEHLARARQARMRGDLEATHEAALDAYEAASPYAKTDDRCREACEAAARIVRESAPRARPTGGPTSFE